MLRASDITAPSEFALEIQRETIRDRRWNRRRDMLWTATAATRRLSPVIVVSGVGLARILGWL